MKTILLRFRYTLYFLIISIIPLTIMGITGDDDYSGAAAGLFLFICLPGIFISFFYAGGKAFQNLIDYAHGYAWPKEEPLFEEKFIKGFKKYLSDEVRIIKASSKMGLVLYGLVRLASLGFIILSIYMMINSIDWEIMFVISMFLCIVAIMIFIAARAVMFNKNDDVKKS